MALHTNKARHAGWLSVARVAGRLVLALGIFLAGYLLIYRPQELRWGATDAEVARAIPDDQIQPKPIFNATRAVTVDAPPERIWPWLVQIGYQRAGWYGYDWIDNDGLSSANRIIPALQHLQVGDNIQMLKGVTFEVVAVVPNHFLVWASPDGGYSMAVALYPLNAHHTRLVWQVRAAYTWTAPSVLLPQLFADLSDLIAIRQNLLGIQARAEGVAPEAPAITYTELGLWLITFLSFLVAETGLVARRDWLRPGLAVAATGLMTVGLVLVKPPLWVDGLAVIGVCGGLWGISRPAPHRASGGTEKQAAEVREEA